MPSCPTGFTVASSSGQELVGPTLGALKMGSVELTDFWVQILCHHMNIYLPMYHIKDIPHMINDINQHVNQEIFKDHLVINFTPKTK